MPAISVGLAEVEQRLQALRRRLNSATLAHAAALTVSSAALGATALIVLGLRGSPGLFRMAAWTGFAVAGAAVAASAAGARRRWLDLDAAARLVDRRAQLTDRLATLMDLSRRPRPALLAPVLLAQALALGPRWQAQSVAPRRWPRSVWLALACLLLLAATAVVERRPQAQPKAAAAVEPVVVGATLAPASVAASAPSGLTGPQSARTLGSLQSSGPLPVGGALPGMAADLPEKRASAQGPLAGLPDRLRHAIQHTFRPRAAGPAQQLAARTGAETPAERNSGREPHRAAGGRDSRTNGAAAHGGAQDRDNGGQTRPAGHTTSGERQAHSPAGAPPPSSFAGASPGAGTGSSPNTVMAAAPAGRSDQGKPATFTLAMTSTLRTVEQAGTTRRRPEGKADALGAAAPSAGAAPAPSRRQLRDDALRKSEIPFEYEDMVKRIYTVRDDR